LWADTVLAALITHNDPASTAACVSFVNILWQVLGMDQAPEPEWWLETYVQTARDLEGLTMHEPRGGAFTGYRGSVWEFSERVICQALDQDLSVLEACQQWFSGAFLLETVPSVLYILMRHGHDFEEGVVRAVNDTKDNDTLAAIVGAVLGALHGKKEIPQRWIDNLAGHTCDDDKGRVFELVEEARGVFWE